MTALFSKILVATDGSELNRSAVEEALRIARACGSTICAVYVADTGSMESGPADLIGGVWDILEREGVEALNRIRAQAYGLHLEPVLLQGKPAEEIVRYAMEKKIELIVIGTKGKRGSERILLGSVAENVIRSAPCKVLVVK